EGARGRRQPAFDREPHPLRLVVDAVAFDMVDAPHKAVGVLALFAQLDKPRDGHARSWVMQHRVRDHGGFHRGGGKARGDGENKKTDDESDQMPTQQDGADAADRRQCRRRPPPRLALGGEIDDDAEAVGGGQPRQQAVRGNFLGGPLPQLRFWSEARPRPNDMPWRANAADRPRPLTRPRTRPPAPPPAGNGAAFYAHLLRPYAA